MERQPSIVDNFGSKDEKQRQNEEISIMKSASTESWEFISPISSKKYITGTESSLESQPNTNQEGAGASSTANNSKHCFIDASSLLDDSEMYCIEHPNLPQTGCFGPKPDNDQASENKGSANIKDQYAQDGSFCDELMLFQCEEQANLTASFEQQDQERKKGQKIFENSINQFSGHKINVENDSGNYFSDEKNSASTSATDDRINLSCTLEYAVPTDTPFNSIVQLDYTRFKVNRQQQQNSDVEQESGPLSTPSKIRGEFVSSKKSYDESIPIISGGSSIEDHYTPKQCSSPQVRRKTENCPIISGGSVVSILDDESSVKSKLSSSSSSNASWTISFHKNDKSDSKIKETPKVTAATSVDSAVKGNCGFYVDFAAIKDVDVKNANIDDRKEKTHKTTIHEDLLRKSTGFYIDFSSSDNKADNGNVKKMQASDSEQMTKSKTIISAEQEKKNIFSMFVDISGDEKFSPNALSSSFSKRKCSAESIAGGAQNEKKVFERAGRSLAEESQQEDEAEVVLRKNAEMNALRKDYEQATKQRHSWNETEQQQQQLPQRYDNKKLHKRSISVSSDHSATEAATNNPMNMLDSKIPFLSSKTSSMNIDSSVPSPMDDFSSKSLSSNYSNNSVTNSNSSNCGGGLDLLDQERKRQKDAKINETFDKSSVGSITDGILSSSSSLISTTTDTDDVTFQNNIDNLTIEVGASSTSMINPNPHHYKKNDAQSSLRSNPTMDPILEQHYNKAEKSHTMETLQATIEKQKQLLETVNENIDENQKNKSFYVKLSDMDKPDKPLSDEQTFVADIFSNSMSSALRGGRHRGGSARNKTWNMSCSTGTGQIGFNLASSFENSKSLSRLFPHLSKAFSSSVPTNMELTNTISSATTNCNIAYNNNHFLNQSNIMCDCIESVTTDFSCTSSITSSRSGIEDSADDSSISCRQRLGEDLLKMFLQEIATDVAIEVGGKKMRAHKCILRSRCQYFAAILAGNWLNNSGNIISLPAEYSFSTVHFALCHIYSGASHPPEGISLMELASLADLLGLEGLKEVTAYALKINYCHNFHKPCSGCIDGICSVLPTALNHGLDELYRKCLKWVCKYYIRVWSTRAFSQLPKDLLNRCRQQIVAHMNSESVINIILDCEQLLSILAPCRWATNVENIIRDVFDACVNYMSEHFSNLIASDSFLSLGHSSGNGKSYYTLTHIENILLRTAATLTPDQACKSYPRANRLNKLLSAKVITVSQNNDEGGLEEIKINNLNPIKVHHEQEEMDWSEDFSRLVTAILSEVEKCLIRQCSRAMRVTSWSRMDVELRNKIQKLACLTEAANNTSIEKLSSRSSISKYNYASSGSSGFSSSQSRNNDIQQVRLTMIQQQNAQNSKNYQPPSLLPNTNINNQFNQRGASAQMSDHSQNMHYNNFDMRGKQQIMATATSRSLSKTASKANVPTTLALMNTKNNNLKAMKKLSNDDNFHNKANLSDKEDNSLVSLPNMPTKKSIEIRSRYLEAPVRSAKSLKNDKVTKVAPKKGVMVKQKSSTDGSATSNTSSPALSLLARKKIMNGKSELPSKRNESVLNKPKESSNLSLDSLSSTTTRRPKNLNLMKTTTARLPSNDKLDISIDSLVSVSVKSSSKCSQESLLLNTKVKNKENLEKLIKPTKASAEREKLNKMNLMLVRNRNRTSTNVVTTSDSSPSSIGARSSTAGFTGKNRSNTKSASDSSSKKSFLSQKSRAILAKREQKLMEAATAVPEQAKKVKSVVLASTQIPKSKLLHQNGSQNSKKGKSGLLASKQEILETKNVSSKLERSSTFCKECPDNPDLLEISD